MIIYEKENVYENGNQHSSKDLWEVIETAESIAKVETVEKRMNSWWMLYNVNQTILSFKIIYACI